MLFVFGDSTRQIFHLNHAYYDKKYYTIYSVSLRTSWDLTEVRSTERLHANTFSKRKSLPNLKTSSERLL